MRNAPSIRAPCVRLPILLALLFAGSCASPRTNDTLTDPAPERESMQAYEAWKEERTLSLASPTGYLALCALLWLGDGPQSIGSDPSCDLVLPAGRAPRKLGVVVPEGEGVLLVAAQGEHFVIDGAPCERVELVSDIEGEPTRVGIGELTLWLIERSGSLGLRVRDPESPVLTAFLASGGIETFPYDSNWSLAGSFEPAVGEILTLPNVLGGVFETESAGSITLEIQGKVVRLTCIGDPKTELSIVFGDSTNGKETYGGGRFLDFGPSDADGNVRVDFNRAYNPPCSLSPFTTCPLPPEGNVLSTRVLAGERSGNVLH